MDGSALRSSELRSYFPLQGQEQMGSCECDTDGSRGPAKLGVRVYSIPLVPLTPFLDIKCRDWWEFSGET